jgi:hypothetical protein
VHCEDKCSAITDRNDNKVLNNGDPLRRMITGADHDDGTLVISPVAARMVTRSDHAGLPVVMLRYAEGKMHRVRSMSAECCKARRDSQASRSIVASRA